MNKEKIQNELPPLNQMWKVPFRQVYCFTAWDWLKAVFHCHIWIRIFPQDTGNLPK